MQAQWKAQLLLQNECEIMFYLSKANFVHALYQALDGCIDGHVITLSMASATDSLL